MGKSEKVSLEYGSLINRSTLTPCLHLEQYEVCTALGHYQTKTFSVCHVDTLNNLIALCIVLSSNADIAVWKELKEVSIENTKYLVCF